jgi:predicted RND superfamily exporter protein
MLFIGRSVMEKFTSGIVKRRKLIIIIFITLAVLCGVMAMGVPVNYNLEDYLPKDSNSTEGMSLMEKEFDEDFPTASIMVRNVSVHTVPGIL